MSEIDWSARTLAVGEEAEPSAVSLDGRDLPPGRLGDRYELVGLLGSGGMGVVYRAIDHELSETVALKMIRSELAAKAEILARFRQEVRLARRVTHRNVARSFDFGTVGGVAFLTMEFIEGTQLSDLLREGAMPMARVVSIATDVSRGLAAAHAAGIVHRDLKPENIMLRKGTDVAVVTDFGVAFSIVESSRHTGGGFVGTPAYMAPEQVEGSDAVDGRADQFALGVMLYELLTAELPFKGSGIYAMALARLFNPAPDPRALREDIPDALANLVLKCLARQPSDRFASMEEVARALENVTKPVETRKSDLGRIGVRNPNAMSVGVVPFRTVGFTEDVSLIYAEEFADRLSESRSLRVRSGATIGAGAIGGGSGSTESALDFGKRLGVDAVLHGSVTSQNGALTFSLRVTMVRDGFQIWAKRFHGKVDDLPMLLERASTDVRGVFGQKDATVQRAVETAQALELHMQARRALQNLTPERMAEARDLLQRAIVMSPDNPTLMASYAIALSRSLVMSNDTDLARKQGRELADRAMFLAPERAEPRIALASIALASGDHLNMARLVREALDRAPDDADANELAARVLAETHDLTSHLVHVEAALLAEPHFTWLHRLTARTRALYGDWEDVDRLLRTPAPEDADFTIIGNSLRMCLWRGDRVTAATFEIGTFKSIGTFQRVLLERMQQLICAPSPEGAGALVEAIEKQASGNGITVRGRTFLLQLLAELALYGGLEDRAIQAIAEAVKNGLFDAPWLERCPLLANIRDTPKMLPLREIVRGRSDTVQKILTS